MREGIADPGHGGGDFACYLLVEGYQLGGALADVASNGLCLRSPCDALSRRTTARAIGNRKIFRHNETRCACVLYHVPHARARRIKIRGAVARYFGRRLQLVGCGARCHHVGVGCDAQRVGARALPIY
ncbi:hypothetical protein BHQ21_23840 [Mycobacterium sherrisii]|uniref:Uncharacterized protein n=1 Tax=Mycobacterium sherrisii TaxID=243061 RepID=A0A1E3SG70_9MYCO|nr:hypothetical protein BHQ21_23840 [Mycobacterium sherrisii]